MAEMPSRVASVVTPAPRDRWHELFTASEESFPFQSPDWFECILAAGGFEDASRLYVLEGGRELILPLVRHRGWARGLRPLESLPAGWGFAGLVARDRVRSADVRAVLEPRGRTFGRVTTIRPGPLSEAAWQSAAAAEGRRPHVVHLLDLEGGWGEVWARRLSTEARTKIRRSERAGLAVECDTAGRLLAVFHDLNERWLRERASRRGLPPQLVRLLAHRREPRFRIDLVAERLRDACRIWVAFKDGSPVAAAIVLVLGRVAVYWRSAMDRELAGPTRAGDLLQRLAIEDACAAGCRFYHMGESGGVGSLEAFKARFGAIRHTYHEYPLRTSPVAPYEPTLDF